MYKNKRIILIIPVFNERDRIELVLKKTKMTPIDEVCVVDDGSNDGSAQITNSIGVTVFTHLTRTGVGAAIRTGVKYARSANFDIIVICAGNDKDNPQEVERLLKPIIDENCDYVQGSRYLKGGKYANMPFYREIGCQIFSLFFSILSGKRFTDATNGFRAYTLNFISNKEINIDQNWLNGYELEYYLQYKAVNLGYKVKEVPVSKVYPTKKTTKIRPLIDWFHMITPVILLRLKLRK